MSLIFRYTALVLLGSILFTQVGCSKPTASKPKAPPKKKKKTVKKDPANAPDKKQQEVWANFKQGIIDRQWDTVYSNLSLNSQKLLLGSMIIGAQRISKTDPAKELEFKKLADTYKLAEEQLTLPRPALKMKSKDLPPLAKAIGEAVTEDQRAKCFSDVMSWIVVNAPQGLNYRFLDADELNRTELTSVAITRNSARGKLETTIPPDEEGGETETKTHDIVFVLELDWKIDLEASEP
jgi:hypothetical protein